MKVSIRSIEMRLSQIADANDVAQTGRWFFLLDRQANGAAPAAMTDYLSTATIHGLRNLAARRRFKILMDKVANVSDQAVSGTIGRYWKVYMKFRRPLVVEYNAGVAGTVADIVTNSLYLCTIGLVAAGATCNSLYGNIRIRYTDM